MTNKNVSLLPLAVMLVLAVSVPAQDKGTEPSPLTNGYFNGQTWRGFSPETRSAYFAGYMDALAVRKQPLLFEGCYPVNVCSMGNHMHELDVFYEYPGNRHIPIMVGILWVHGKLSGINSEVLEQALVEHRTFWHKRSEDAK